MRKFIIGIGGSATNDGGAGMLQALGFELLDSEGKQIRRGAIGLRDLAEVRSEHVLPELSDCRFLIACDVTNPLCGPDGCSAIYGPQKGADKIMIRDMDKWLGSYAEITKKHDPDADPTFPGAGARAGLDSPFLPIWGRVEIRYSACAGRNTSEGLCERCGCSRDRRRPPRSSDCHGKSADRCSETREKYGARVVAFAGSVTQDAAACNQAGIDAFFPIVRGVCSLDEAMNSDNAKRNWLIRLNRCSD